MGRPKSVSLEDFEMELKNFFDLCKENDMSDSDIAKLCQPLLIEETNLPNEPKSKNCKKIIFFLIVLTIALMYLLTYFESMSWHFAAIGRIILIQALPIWDWRHLKNEKCLIPNNFMKRTSSVETSINFDCALCESLEKIHVIDPEFAESHLKTRYVDIHNPVIISGNDALSDWLIKENLNVLEGSEILRTFPCQLSTNIHNSRIDATVGRLLKRSENFEDFFLHFRLCDFETVKALRPFAPKPKYLPSEVSPVKHSWILMSRNYKVSAFKNIQLRESIAVVGQSKGSNVYRLLPRENCYDYCKILDIRLEEGEVLVLTSLWNLEYLPSDADEESVAIILEMR